MTSPLLSDAMVPKGGFEPPRGLPTTPSRWRVYQFHHFGIGFFQLVIKHAHGSSVFPDAEVYGFGSGAGAWG
jgi:hypothetical protein